VILLRALSYLIFFIFLFFTFYFLQQSDLSPNILLHSNLNFTNLQLFQLIWEDLDLTLEKSLAKTLILPLMSGGPSLAGTPSPSPSGSVNGLAALALSHTGERNRRGEERRGERCLFEMASRFCVSVSSHVIYIVILTLSYSVSSSLSL
jgi:hypothetical protein